MLRAARAGTLRLLIASPLQAAAAQREAPAAQEARAVRPRARLGVARAAVARLAGSSAAQRLAQTVGEAAAAPVPQALPERQQTEREEATHWLSPPRLAQTV